MGDLVPGDDGKLVEQVGSWAAEKHNLLCKYVDITRSVRSKWIAPGKAGATYIDVFCGPGRSQVKKTGEFIDGSCVAAWKMSVRSKAPFSMIYLADLDPVRRRLAADRLRDLGAPVTELDGDAATATALLPGRLSQYGLHFAFLDPFNLGALNFNVMRSLALLPRIDILVHISKMDMQRNLGFNIGQQSQAFESFAPGWRAAIDLGQGHQRVRVALFDYWRKQVSSLDLDHSPEMKLITGGRGQHLYWLMLVARHELAVRFWQTIAKDDAQGRFL